MIKRKIKNILFKFYHLIYFPNVIIGKSFKFWGFPKFINFPNSKIEIGDNFTAISNQYKNPIGLNHAVMIRTECEKAQIKIGSNVGMSGGTISATNSVTVGDNCLIGANCIIVDSDYHQISPNNRRFESDSKNIKSAPVTIKNNVWLSMNVVVLKGVVIGENSVIGANSVVSKSIPPNVIASGIPAKVMKEI